jgi:3,4-dihydroxy 2-butanone 4-phosphate synthase / GTP cyclohydrolase II
VNDAVSIDELRLEFSQYYNELSPVVELLKEKSEVYFDVSGDDDQMVIFSNILLKLHHQVKQNYKLFKRQTSSKLETKHGVFKMYTYQSKVDYTHHLALVKGDISNKDNILLRVHSSCITGDIFGSLKCDCGEQLAQSMKLVNDLRRGVILYLFQEGRGINIINKIKSYKLQSGGLDTVEANEALGFPPEMRDYTCVRDMLADLKVKSIRLLTNNPDKINKLTELGVIVQGVESIEVLPNSLNKRYLRTKKDKMNHKLRKIK